MPLLMKKGIWIYIYIYYTAQSFTFTDNIHAVSNQNLSQISDHMASFFPELVGKTDNVNSHDYVSDSIKSLSGVWLLKQPT